MDKDQGSYTDDFIGTITTTVAAGAKELEIEGPFLKQNRGRLWLKVRPRVCYLYTLADNIVTVDRKHTGKR